MEDEARQLLLWNRTQSRKGKKGQICFIFQDKKKCITLHKSYVCQVTCVSYSKQVWYWLNVSLNVICIRSKADRLKLVQKNTKTSYSPSPSLFFCFVFGTSCTPVCLSLQLKYLSVESFLLNSSVWGAFGCQSLQKEPAADNKWQSIIWNKDPQSLQGQVLNVNYFIVKIKID